MKGRKWLCRTAVAAGIAAFLFLIFLLIVPVAEFDDPLSLVILDRNKELIAAAVAGDEQWRFPPASTVPPRLETAILLFEDRRFHKHPGVDPVSVARAIRDNIRERKITSGASTITMQVVRLSRKNRPRTFREKIIEAFMALRLELSKNKNEILSMYISNAPYGGNIVGVEAAAWRYLGHSTEHLTWADAALLAVLPNSPALIHPGRNRDNLISRRNMLLSKMKERGIIDHESYTLSIMENVPEKPEPLPQLSMHLISLFENSPRRYEQSIVTTIDRNLQERAMEVTARHARRMKNNLVHNSAAMIMDTDTGEVLAYIGNTADIRSGKHAPFVDCIRARRSPGSALKPFLYAAMLQEGAILPSMIVPDIPIRLGGFAPENFDRTYSGAVQAKTALSRSLNVPAVRMLSDYGVDRFAVFLRDTGLSTLDKPASHYGLSLVLGGSEATLWDLTGMYAGMVRAAKGRNTPFSPPLLELIDSPEKGVKTRADLQSESPGPLDAGAAYLSLQALLEVQRPGIDAAWRRFASSRKISWKTGTSWGFRDAWALGVTSRYAVGVWVGNASGEGRPGLIGHSAAAPVLMDLFDLLPTEDNDIPAPYRHIRETEICSHSGYRKGMNCENTRKELVPIAALRAAACPYCRTVHCDEECKNLVHAVCEEPHRMQTMNRFVLPPAMEWFYARSNPTYTPLPPWRKDCAVEGAGTTLPPLSMVHPRPGGTVLIPRNLDGERSRVVFTAAHRKPDTRIFWHLGDRYLGSTNDPHQIELAPPEGSHLLTLVDENGEFISHSFTVVE